MIDLSKVGAIVGKGGVDQLQLGIYLPKISANKGYRLFADLIHYNDQYLAEVPATPVELKEIDVATGLWQYQGHITQLSGTGKMGAQGRYLYRYRLERNGQTLVWAFADPFAQSSGDGTTSAFDYPPPPAFNWTDGGFKVPEVNGLIVYEMMVDDFADDFDGVISKLDYLESLSVNCIELMPVTNVPEPYRWGYMPLSYFAIEERYGGKEKLKLLVNECHARGIALLHDAVYAHMHDEFCYKKVYDQSGEINPMIGPFAGDMFGVGTNFNLDLTYDYFMAVNKYFLDELHFDGFRYDYVPGIYDGPTGKGYSKLVYETYQYSKPTARFQGSSHSRIIQAAEYLEKPKEILQKTYTTASKRWTPMLQAQHMIQNYGSVPEGFVHSILLIDFDAPWPTEYHNVYSNEQFPVAPLQFIECHDKSRLMYFLSGSHSPYHGGFDLFGRDRGQWYKLQPFAIALMTCEGVPLIWQGQEFGEIYGKHDDGGSRVLAARPLHWNYFYEQDGRALTNLYRKLGQMRQQYAALRSRQSYFYYQHSNLGSGLVAWLRQSPSNGADVLVLINFSEYGQNITVPMKAGTWVEQLNSISPETVTAAADGEYSIYVPSNYGKIFINQAMVF